MKFDETWQNSDSVATFLTKFALFDERKNGIFWADLKKALSHTFNHVTFNIRTVYSPDGQVKHSEISYSPDSFQIMVRVRSVSGVR